MVDSASQSPRGVELSLPPRVVGDVCGYLVMKVDEVLWARQPPGEISAGVMWWGEENPTTFRPADVSQQGLCRKHTSVIYEIRTSKALLESYLRKCGCLKIAVADKYGMPIGCASVPELHKILQVSPFQNYYPIVNNFGNRIGDLHVSFNLRMTSSTSSATLKSSLEANECLKSKKAPKRLSEFAKKKHRHNGQSRVNTVKPKPSPPSAISEKCAQKTDTENVSVALPKSHEECESVRYSKSTDNMISQILERGKRLRDAMAHAVIEDNIKPPCDTSSGSLLKTLDGSNINSYDHMSVNMTNIEEYINGTRKGTREIPSQAEKKILEFLAGKPMTEDEENEAVEALRNTTPSKDIMNKVNKAVEKEQMLPHVSCQSVKKVVQEPTEIIADLTNAETSQKEESDSSFDLDAELLSHVNCLRISVISLLLNSVGLKRINSSSFGQKKVAKVTSSAHLPPGVTYFVEYQLPAVCLSHTRISDITRYCSKKQVGYEVKFGDRSVHNIPALLRNKLFERSALISLISSLTFKVCARHLNQRVPVCLGLASPDTAMYLLGSTHLRHEYVLPVIASDHLPVAELKVCIELGRDRIHFGGLFDPENNSLGVASNKESRESLISKGGCRPSNIKATTPSALVTRNVSKPLGSEVRWKGKIGNSLAGSNKMAKPSLKNETKNAKSCSSGIPSAPSTQRSESAFIQSQIITLDNQDLTCASDLKCTKSTRTFLKHELAITIQQICDCLPLDGTVPDDRDCFVSYKFPSWDASTDSIVEWNSYSTEPTVCLQDTWFRPQCRVHSVVLPDTISLHVFLRESFRMCGIQSDGDSTVVFSVCERYYSDKVKDTLLAQAFLPYSSLVALENAYNSAANEDPRFSESSCASVVIDLPLHFSPAFKVFQSNNRSHLKIKFDYRQLHNRHSPQHRSFPQSHRDSLSRVTQSPPLNENKNQKNILCLNEASVPPINTSSIPHWAKTPDKQDPPWNGFKSDQITYSHQKAEVDLLTTKPLSIPVCDVQGHHACWEPVPETQYKPGVCTKSIEPEWNYRHHPSSRVMDASHRNVMDLLHIDDVKSEIASSHSYNKPLSMYSQSCHDLYWGCSNEIPGVQNVGREHFLMNEDYSAGRTVLTRQTADKSTSPLNSTRLYSAIHSPRRPHRATYRHVSTATESRSHETTVKSCQTSPRHTNTSFREEILVVGDGLGVSKSCGDQEIPLCDVRGTLDKECKSENEEPALNSAASDSSNKKCELDEKSMASDLHQRKDVEKLPQFNAKIGVECAFHLQLSVKDDYTSEVFVSCHPCEISVSSSKEVSSPPELGTTYVSPKVAYRSDPEWCWSCDTQLPADLLILAVRRLVFKVWESKKTHSQEESNLSYLIGFAAVDLTVLAAGLPLVSGVFNIMDFTGMCRGQIKLSVEPTEDISKLLDFGNMFLESRVKVNPIKTASSSMYLAHCAYPEFPSHVAQDSDMRIHLMDPQLSDAALSAGYQLLLQHCRKLSEDLSVAADLPYDSLLPDSGISLERKPVHLDLKGLACGGVPLIDSAEDPSVCLRKKLSELDSLTKLMKSKLITNTECRHANQSPPASLAASDVHNLYHHYCGNTNKLSYNASKTDNCEVGVEQRESDKLCSKCKNEDTVLTSNSRPKVPPSLAAGQLPATETLLSPAVFSADKGATCFDDNSCPHEVSYCRHKHRCDERHSGGGLSCESEPSSESEVRNTVKPRKTWKKHEDLIDLRSLELDSKQESEEETAQLEEVAEWLSNSAMHIFNPILFYDLMNGLSSGASSVKVVELDNDSDPSVVEEPAGRPGTPLQIQNDDSKKDVSHCFSVESHDSNGRCASSAVDTDSGVDIDSASVFRPSASRFVCKEHGQTGKRKITSSGHGPLGASSGCGGMSSTSSSGVSTTLYSAGPSSLSETPCGSPQRYRLMPEFKLI